MKPFSIGLFVRGMAMGVADLVPGISGGTIALITGIYSELLKSIKSIDGSALKSLKRDGIAATWRLINGNWLVTLLAGMLTSVALFSNGIDYLLDAHTLSLWSFFSGVVIASAIFLLRRYRPRHWHHWFLLVAGVQVAVALAQMPVVVSQNSYLSLFLAGSVAVSAMILPGISGTLIVVTLGLYPTMIAALTNLQFDVLGAFSVGGIVGLLLFSRFLSWIMDRHQTALMATMCGFLIGSLNLLWPWRQSSITSLEKLSPMATINLLPEQYATVMQTD
ncbi:MAG: DUF368 domain-containing protein, partial [Porticoccaceae bacterium]|nr:DUF368 domain-containing protein [Porticoccaceae bacterium]